MLTQIIDDTRVTVPDGMQGEAGVFNKGIKILKTNDMEWIFDGIGTALISGFIGLFVGGYAGYKVGIKKADVKQKQKAKNNII